MLRKLSKELIKPKAILIISAHWMTDGTYVTYTENPEQIFDFYGFPQELYAQKFNFKGSLDVAEKIKKLLSGTTDVKFTQERGIDHAGWALLKYLFPGNDVPVVNMSIDYYKPVKYHYELGKKLSELRKEGVLIIGSGNIVHNLRMINFEDTYGKSFEWAQKFDDEIKQMVIEKNHIGTINYKNLGEIAQLSVPTPDHFLPLIYIIGMQQENEITEIIYEGIQNGSISMTSFMIN